MNMRELEANLFASLKERFPEMISVQIRATGEEGSVLEIKSILKRQTTGAVIEHIDRHKRGIALEKLVTNVGGWWFNRFQKIQDIA